MKETDQRKRTSQLGINLQVLLIENLKDRVEETTQWCVVRLLHNLGTGLPAVMLTSQGCQPVDIHDIVGVSLVGAAEHELQLLGGHTNGLEHAGDHLLVVLDTVLDQFQRRLHGIQKCMHVRKENHDLAARSQKLTNLDCGHIVGNMRAASGSGT